MVRASRIWGVGELDQLGCGETRPAGFTGVMWETRPKEFRGAYASYSDYLGFVCQVTGAGLILTRTLAHVPEM